MKLIFALGNIGSKYDGTRHNVGFLALDKLASREGVQFSDKPKFKVLLTEYNHEGEKVLLAKPTTFYNLAGEAYRALMDFYKLTPEDTLIIHDELALPFGTVRTRVGGSDAGNNGIKSVNLHGGNDSNRVRVGMANEQRALIGDVDFVLGRFSLEESNLLSEKVLPKVLEATDAFINGNHSATSHKLIDTDNSPL